MKARQSISNHSGMTRQDMLLALAAGVAVVAVLVVLGVRNARTQRAIQTTQARMAVLRTAIEQHQLEIGQPPRALADLIAAHSEIPSSPFLADTTVTNDAWGSPYAYTIHVSVVTNPNRVVTTNRNHVIVSMGPDTMTNAQDNIVLRWHAEQSPSPYR